MFLSRFVGWKPGAAGPRFAHQKGHTTVTLFNSLHNWRCRDGALNKTSVEDGVIKVVIVLSDSTDDTEGGDTRKSARYCQCGGERRLNRPVPEATDNRAKQVILHVHAHVRRNGALSCSVPFETVWN